MLAGKKIIFLLGSLETGGAEGQALLLARHLAEREHARVEVWGFGEPGRVAQLCRELKLPCRGVPFRAGVGLAADLGATASLLRQLRRSSPDLLLPYTRLPNLICGLGWRFTGAKGALWQQRDYGIGLNPSLLHHRLALRNMPLIVSNSSHAANYLKEEFRVEPGRVVVIPNGVALPPPSAGRLEFRRSFGIADAHFVGCMLGNFHSRKDHLTAVEAWGEVVHGLPRGGRALLFLAGRDDGTMPAVRSRIRELGLEGEVRLLGGVDEVAPLLAGSDVALHCAEHEGCPNAVLEAMAAGLPVVGSDNPGVREALGTDGEGLLVPHGDARGLGRLLLELSHDAGRRQRLGTANRLRAGSFFSVETMCRRTVALIKRQLPGASPGAADAAEKSEP